MTIEEKDLREDVVFLPLKHCFAVDATFVVVVTANIVCVCVLKGCLLKVNPGVINIGRMRDKIHVTSWADL